MNKKFKKKKIKIVLLLLILCINLGYAALTSNLNIVGTSNINNASWDVHWNNVQITNGSVTGTNVTTAAHILTGNTEVEYSITLGTPGDFYEFTVDAVNAGSIDAMIGSFSNKVYESNGTTERTLPDYLTYTVTYSDGVSLANNHLLSANSTETYKVRVEFKTDISANQLPSSADTLVFKFNVSYVQADSNATGINHAYTGDIYAWNTTEIYIGTSTINDLTSTVTAQSYYTSATDVMNASGYYFFNKYTVVLGTITEGYSCITFGLSGLEPACLKGYINGSEYNYQNTPGNWAVLNELNNNPIFTGASGHCTLETNKGRCQIGYVGLYHENNDDVSADDYYNDILCVITSTGEGICYE